MSEARNQYWFGVAIRNSNGQIDIDWTVTLEIFARHDTALYGLPVL